MKQIKIDMRERLRAEAKIQREGVFDIFHDEHGNRGTSKTKIDTDMADLLEAAAKEIDVLEAFSTFIGKDSWSVGVDDGAIKERRAISEWLRSLDRDGGEINRFLPTTLANWIDEEMHLLGEKEEQK